MFKRKTIIIALVVVIVALVTLAGFALQKKNSSSLGFQAYAPQILPQGLEVTERTVDVWNDGPNPFAYHKILTFELSGSRGSIGQAKKSDYTSRVVTCDYSVVNQVCKMYKTPRGQEYTMELTFKDNKQLSAQRVGWFKDDTYIWLSLHDGSEALSENDISQTVDSFSPVHYAKLKTRHYTPGP